MVEKISSLLGKMFGVIVVALLTVLSIGGLATGLAVLIIGIKFLWSAVML